MRALATVLMLGLIVTKAFAEQPELDCSKAETAWERIICRSHENLRPPSFDCSKATSAVEHAICKSARLSAADREMAEVYRELLGECDRETQEYIKKNQLDWLTERDQCTKELPSEKRFEKCIEEKYSVRQENFTWLLTNEVMKDAAVPGLEHAGYNSPTITTSVGRLLRDIFREEGFSFSPEYYARFSKELYIVEVTSTPSSDQGLYAVNTRKQESKKILGGLPSIVARTSKWWLIKTNWLRHGVARGTYTTIYLVENPDHTESIGTTDLATEASDGQDGFCGRGEEIGLDEFVEVKEISLTAEGSRDFSTIVFSILSQNCKTRVEERKVEGYTFTGSSFKKRN